MAKRSKASYRRAALKGWRTRRANQRKKTRKAKKVASHDAVEIETGYAGRNNNSYTLIVRLRRNGRTDSALSDYIESLCKDGFFDATAKRKGFASDLRWATFHNQYDVRSIRDTVRGVRLVGFERRVPGRLP